MKAAFDLAMERERIENAVKDPHAFFTEMCATGGPIAKVLIAMLKPKIELLCQGEQLPMVAVALALESLATVEMLLVALEMPDKFFEGMLPKLKNLIQGADTQEPAAKDANRPGQTDDIERAGRAEEWESVTVPAGSGNGKDPAPPKSAWVKNEQSIGVERSERSGSRCIVQ